MRRIIRSVYPIVVLTLVVAVYSFVEPVLTISTWALGVGCMVLYGMRSLEHRLANDLISEVVSVSKERSTIALDVSREARRVMEDLVRISPERAETLEVGIAELRKYEAALQREIAVVELIGSGASLRKLWRASRGGDAR